MKASLSLGLDISHWVPFDLQSFLYFFTSIDWFAWLRHLFYVKPSFFLVEHSSAAVIVQTRGGRIRIKLIKSNILIPVLTTATSMNLTFRKLAGYFLVFWLWWQYGLFCILKKNFETVKIFLDRNWKFFIHIFLQSLAFQLKNQFPIRAMAQFSR